MSGFDFERDEFPGLQLPDKFGCYLRWPENGTDWIHPEDVATCTRLIPSNRVFQKQVSDRQYNLLVYGPDSIRVRPTLWLEVETDGYRIGDRVEIRSRMGRRRPAIAKIEEVLFNAKQRQIKYVLSVNENRLLECYRFDEIQPVFELGKPMDARQQAIADKARFS